MSIKRYKTKDKLIKRFKVFLNSSPFGKFKLDNYFYVYLWEDFEGMMVNADVDENTLACFVCNDYDVVMTTQGVLPNSHPLVGEMHFVKDHTGVEVIVHEVAHAMCHVMRRGILPMYNIIAQDPQELEEAYCNNFGEIVFRIYEEIQLLQ